MDHAQLSARLQKHKKVILVENNSTGQLLPDLKLANREPDSTILRFDGKPFFKDELVAKLMALQ